MTCEDIRELVLSNKSVPRVMEPNLSFIYTKLLDMGIEPPRDAVVTLGGRLLFCGMTFYAKLAVSRDVEATESVEYKWLGVFKRTKSVPVNVKDCLVHDEQVMQRWRSQGSYVIGAIDLFQFAEDSTYPVLPYTVQVNHISDIILPPTDTKPVDVKSDE